MTRDKMLGLQTLVHPLPVFAFQMYGWYWTQKKETLDWYIQVVSGGRWLISEKSMVSEWVGGWNQRRTPSRFLLLLFLGLPLSARFRFPCFGRSCGSTICIVRCFFAAFEPNRKRHSSVFFRNDNGIIIHHINQSRNAVLLAELRIDQWLN